jgi:hypothetical protein
MAIDEWYDLMCKATVRLMPKYLDDDLPEPQTVRLEQHIITCPGCHIYLTQLRRTIAAVSYLGGGMKRQVGDQAAMPSDEDERDQGADGANDAGPADQVIAYKFLGRDRVAPFAQTRWPEPGDGWVLAAESASVCRRAVHACRAGDLAYWLDDTLWRVELGGEITESASKVVAERGRLLAPVDGWPEVSGEFIAACAARLGSLLEAAEENQDWRSARMVNAYAREIEDDADPASVSYTVAHAAGIVGWLPGEGMAAKARGERTPFDAERRRQSRWLVGALGLAD